MRRIAGVVVGCLVLGAAPIQAADLPVKAVPVVVPAFDWTGWYVGGHLGAIRSRTSVGAYDGFLFPAILVGGVPLLLIPGTAGTLPGVSGHDTSWLGGVQIGHNWQTGRWVYGIEADVSATSLNEAGSTSATRFPGTTTSSTVTANYAADLDWIATLRARFGMTFDRVLIYATAGAALTRIKTGATTTVANGPAIIIPAGSSSMTTSTSHTRFGWTLGAGVEWAINNAWSIAAEYRHTRFGNFSTTLQIPDGLGTVFATGSPNIRIATDQVTARVNYHFSARQ